MRLRKLWANEAGNTAIIFGLAIIPLIVLGGGVVDFAQRARVRAQLQSATDTAAIAAARVLQLGQLARDDDVEARKSEAIDTAAHILDATIANLGGSDAVNFDFNVDDEQVIKISTEYDVDTSFLGIIGIDELKATASSEVKVPDAVLIEISMVLDYSGSMRDSDKYVRMTEAARAFITKVEKNRAATSKIGIVPFSEFVYMPMLSSYVRDSDSSHDHDDHGGGWGDWGGWGGAGNTTTCLLNRDYPYSVSDEAPSSGLPASQWPEGDQSRCDDYPTANLRVRDLTSEFGSLSSALGEMQPVGLTNIALGMEMGWQMLTPELPFDTARDFSDDQVRKVIILLTDGMQTVPAMGPSGDVSTEAADETTAELCENAKDSAIRIFSIAYDVDDASVESLLHNCASGGESYFDASITEISDVFEEIYSQIAESVWVSR